MKKQIIDKTMLFMSGMLARFEESREYFEKFEVIFTAGTKTFSFTAEITTEDSLSFIFSGEKHNGTAENVKNFIAEKMPEYDALEIKYIERGRTIVITADQKDVKTTTTGNVQSLSDISTGNSGTHTVGTAVMSKREYYIKPGDAEKLLKTIGIMGANGKVKNDMIRKYNQIDHFVELLVPIIDSLCKKNSKRPVRVIDCGCGKSYLTFVLNYYIKEVMGRRCEFTGLDINGIVIDDSKKMAAELGYRNMEFVKTDIADFECDKEYDLLLTLHACDTATDKALRFAIDNNVSHIVCVPCCHREMNSHYNLDGFEDVMKQGILKARIADALTDGLRATYLEGCGYDVSVVEYISPLDSPKNLMIRAEKVGEENYEKIMEYCRMCDLLHTSLAIGK